MSRRFHIRQPFMAKGGVFERCIGKRDGAYTRLVDAVKAAEKFHKDTGENVVVRHSYRGTVMASWGTNYVVGRED